IFCAAFQVRARDSVASMTKQSRAARSTGLVQISGTTGVGLANNSNNPAEVRSAAANDDFLFSAGNQRISPLLNQNDNPCAHPAAGPIDGGSEGSSKGLRRHDGARSPDPTATRR